MSETRIGIILLAAGASVRMGTPKQLIPIAGVPLIRRAALAAVGSGYHPVVVVLGANAQSVRIELEGMEVYVAVNPEWSLGMASSIRCGLEKVLDLAPDTEGVVLMLADQPGVTSECLKRLIAGHDHSGLVAARYNHMVGPPALFPREYFRELSQLQGQSGARPLIDRQGEDVVAVDMPEAARDLDTPEDLADFQCSHAERASHPDTTPPSNHNQGRNPYAAEN